MIDTSCKCQNVCLVGYFEMMYSCNDSYLNFYISFKPWFYTFFNISQFLPRKRVKKIHPKKQLMSITMEDLRSKASDPFGAERVKKSKKEKKKKTMEAVADIIASNTHESHMP